MRRSRISTAIQILRDTVSAKRRSTAWRRLLNTRICAWQAGGSDVGVCLDGLPNPAHWLARIFPTANSGRNASTPLPSTARSSIRIDNGSRILLDSGFRFHHSVWSSDRKPIATSDYLFDRHRFRPSVNSPDPIQTLRHKTRLKP
jgi:hypothetical protein